MPPARPAAGRASTVIDVDTTSTLVTFRLGVREYATSLLDVREVVRLQGVADLPGMARPLAGVLDLRGTAVPVLDLRAGPPADSRGDVLVVERPDGSGRRTPVGVAVDQVRAVVPAGELSAAGAAARVLPCYVIQVLRGAAGVVFLVDLQQLVDAVTGDQPVALPQT